MRDYLLNPVLLIIFSCSTAILCLALFKRLSKTGSNYRLDILKPLAISLVLLGLQIFIINRAFGLDNIPNAGYPLAWLANFLLVLTVWQPKYDKLNFVYGIASFFSTLILLGLFVNNFYQYFPTLGSVLSPSYAKKSSINTIVRSTTHSKYNVKTIEGSLFAGGEAKGTVLKTEIPGSSSHFKARSAYLYLPPAYRDKTYASVKFPVMVLLVGTPGNPSSWLQGGLLVNTLDKFAAHHAGITPVVVIADHTSSFSNDTECVDSPHGNAETYLTDDVPQFIKSHYRVSTVSTNWGIGGFSEGGMCAAMLTLRHQSVYQHFLDISGDPYPFLDNRKQTLPVLFNGSKTAMEQHNINWLINHADTTPQLTAQFAIGSDDNKKLVQEMHHSYNEANRQKVTSSFEIIARGTHSFDTWSQAFNDALPKLSYYLGATDCEAICMQ